MSLPRYDSYKDSGVEWIGEIPAGWECKCLRYLLLPGNHGIKIGPFGSALKSEYLTPDGYKVYGQENVINDDFERGFRHIDENKFQELEVYEILPGDLLITMMGTTGLAKLVPDKIKKGIMDSHLIRVRPDDNQVHPNFLQLLINDSTYIFYQKKLLSNGSIMEGLNSSIIKSFSIVLPSLSEQTAIASFLDRKTAEIDQLIANKEKLIALYEEEKTAIINRAVTRGLDPAVKTRPSDVDWLGDIPELWEVKRLKYVINSITGGGTPSTGNPLFWNGIIPWVSPKDMKSAEISETEDYVTDVAVANSSTTPVAPNSILVVVRSGILKHTFPVAINRVTVCLNQDMKAIIPADCLDEKFLYWKLKGLSNIVLTVCNKMGATVDSIEVPDLLSLLVTFPQKAEQTAIVTHIETECTRLDTIIAKFKKQIELFKEYRTTLISEVVTGKIDVRGEVGA